MAGSSAPPLQLHLSWRQSARSCLLQAHGAAPSPFLEEPWPSFLPPQRGGRVPWPSSPSPGSASRSLSPSLLFFQGQRAANVPAVPASVRQHLAGPWCVKLPLPIPCHACLAPLLPCGISPRSAACLRGDAAPKHALAQRDPTGQAQEGGREPARGARRDEGF